MFALSASLPTSVYSCHDKWRHLLATMPSSTSRSGACIGTLRNLRLLVMTHKVVRLSIDLTFPSRILCHHPALSLIAACDRFGSDVDQFEMFPIWPPHNRSHA